jgi:uncharacterized protein (DUF427 family)
MPQAIWNDVVLAQAAHCEKVEDNLYFPAEALDMRYFRPSHTQSLCPWKGVAFYYDVVVGDVVNRDAAWYYPNPKPAAANIAGHVAFWRGVQVTG